MKSKLFNVIAIIIGNIMVAFGFSTLILEHRMISGGVRESESFLIIISILIFQL